MPADAPSTMVALASDRERLITAIDAAVPPDDTDALQTYLTSAGVLGLYDNNTMSTSVANLGDMLDQLGNADDAMAALARIGARDGYRHPSVAVGQTAPMLNSPNITAVLDSVLPMISGNGAAVPQWNAVITALSYTLADASPQDSDGANSTAAIVDKLLLTTDPTIPAEAAPLELVRRDKRGVAVVPVAPPFVDLDKDGLPDVDAIDRFVDGSGNELAIATPFVIAGDTSARDSLGRSTTVPYTYFDLTQTLIGAMSLDNQQLLDPTNGTALNALLGMQFLLGPRAPETKTFDNGTTLTYTGYDTSTQAPLLDLSYAFTSLLRDPNIGDTLALGTVLMTSHSGALSRIIEAGIVANRLGDMFPNAAIAANAPLWDDLRPLIQQITANPQLVHDLMVALQDPNVAHLADRFRDFMTYSDRFDIGSDQSLVIDMGSGSGYSQMPNRAMPDNGYNRSLFQRLAEVIAESEVGQCNKAGAIVQAPSPVPGLPPTTIMTYPTACQLFNIPSLAVFYLQSIAYSKDANGNIVCEDNAGIYDATKTATTGAGCAAFGTGWRPQPAANFNYQWGTVVNTLIQAEGGDAYIESQSTISGFRTHPTPQSLNRALFLTPQPAIIANDSNPIVDKDGDLMTDRLAGTLPVWEKDNFYDEVRPILQAFVDAKQEQTFVDIMTVLNKYWSSSASTWTQHTNPAGAHYTFGAGGVTYEPYIIDILNTTDLYPALTGTAAELNAVTANGKSIQTITANAANFMVTPLTGLTNRYGKSTTTDASGATVSTLSPWHLMADAFIAKRAALAAAGSSSTLWTASVSQIVDIMFRGVNDQTGYHFKNTHIAAVNRGLITMISDRIAAHNKAGDLTAWLSTSATNTLPTKMHDLLTHPILASASDLVTALQGTPRTSLETLLTGLFDPTQPSFNIMRASTAELLQIAPDDNDLLPTAHIVGALLAQNYLPTQLVLLNGLHQADTHKTLNDITARLYQMGTNEPGIPTISAIADGVGDVERVAPGPAKPWQASDYASTMHNIAAFFHDEKYGLPRFITIVQGRDL